MLCALWFRRYQVASTYCTYLVRVPAMPAMPVPLLFLMTLLCAVLPSLLSVSSFKYLQLCYPSKRLVFLHYPMYLPSPTSKYSKYLPPTHLPIYLR